jgi:hypothetical protein
MNLLTVPRKVASLQYGVARLPLTILEKNVVARYLGDEAPLRLTYERLLGSLDEAAGRFLADDDLYRRGQALVRRTDFLAKADELDAKAQARRQQADEQLKAEQEQSRQARAEASQQRERELAAARHSEQDEKRRAQQDADAKARKEKAEAERAAQERVADANRTLRDKEKRIAAEHQLATDAPKRQLATAAERRRDARDQRTQADRLEALAGAEKEARRAN